MGVVGRRHAAQLLGEERAKRTWYAARQRAAIARHAPGAYEQPIHADDGNRSRERRDDQPKGGAGRGETDALGGLVAEHTSDYPGS